MVDSFQGFIEENEKNIISWLQSVNNQVEAFNKQLPVKIEKVFRDNAEKLSRQKLAFEAAGIAKMEEEVLPPTTRQAPAKRESTVVIQVIKNMFVENLSQINYSASGDVNTTVMEK